MKAIQSLMRSLFKANGGKNKLYVSYVFHHAEGWGFGCGRYADCDGDIKYSQIEDIRKHIEEEYSNKFGETKAVIVNVMKVSGC